MADKKSDAAVGILRAELESRGFKMGGLRYEVSGPSVYARHGSGLSVNARRGNKVVALLAGDTLFLDWEDGEPEP